MRHPGQVIGETRDRLKSDAGKSDAGGVQSLHRALDVLEVVERSGGQLSVGEIAIGAGVPAPTAHRLVKTLVARGYMRQLANRHYALGFRLLPLGLKANALLGSDAGPVLSRLVSELGETSNLAVLSVDQAEYVAQVPSAHTMRMFTEVGRKVDLHCTGVGKALLAQLGRDVATDIIRRTGLRAHTPHTITTENRLLAELELIAERGYAFDEEEQELGVRCVAVAVPGRWMSPMALSVSGPLSRVTDRFLERAVPLLVNAANGFADELETEGLRAPSRS